MSPAVDMNFLPANTRETFDILCKQDFISKFTLVGGSALALQIRHRLSEDLDFIYDGDILPVSSIKRNMAKVFPDLLVTRQENNEQIDLVINESKITFFCTGMIALPFQVSGYAFSHKKMRICKGEVIASLKMASIAQRNTMRDYYDLYCLARYHFSLPDIIRQTKKLIPGLSPVTYTENLVYTDDIEEADIRAHLRPQEQVNKNQIAEYFTAELKKIIELI